jgi:hypothetical protein
MFVVEILDHLNVMFDQKEVRLMNELNLKRFQDHYDNKQLLKMIKLKNIKSKFDCFHFTFK